MGDDVQTGDGMWNPTTLYETFDQRLTEMVARLNRKFEENDRTYKAMLEAQWSRTQDGFSASAEATKTAMVSAEKAVLKAEMLANDRSDQQNEWRGTLNDVVNTMMPRAEWAAAHEQMTTDIDQIRSLVAENLPRREYQAQHDALSAQMQALADRMNTAQGAGVGSSRTVTWLFVAVGGIVGLSGFLLALVEFLKG